jgi:predicted metal-dependent hydrolase
VSACQRSGGAKGIRTPDLLNAIQTLSQLSYSPTPDGQYIARAPDLAAGYPGCRGPYHRAMPVDLRRPAAPSATESRRIAALAGGPLQYTLRRSPRSRRLRVTIHPERGVVVAIPPADRRGWARPEPIVEAFLAQRETWIRRHLARQADERSAIARRGPIEDGGLVRYLGELHRVRVIADPGAGRWSFVERRVERAEALLIVHRAAPDGRSPSEVVAAWCRTQADVAIRLAIEAQADALAVTPRGITLRDPRSRWGSASRQGHLSFSWRLILAPPEALETVVVHELAHLRVFGHGPRFWALVEARIPEHRAWRRWLREHSTELHAAFAEPVEPGRADQRGA